MPARVTIPLAPWEVCETPYQPAQNIYFETNFTLGNGFMGARGCLEEGFSDDMERYEGTYLAGVFDDFDTPYVELVNVPELFATRVWVGETELNLQSGVLEDYTRVLNMREGTLDQELHLDGSGRASYALLLSALPLARLTAPGLPHPSAMRFLSVRW